jgi:hypothetical protein
LRLGGGNLIEELNLLEISWTPRPMNAARAELEERRLDPAVP